MGKKVNGGILKKTPKNSNNSIREAMESNIIQES